MAKQTFTTGQVLTAAQMTSLQETAMGGGPATAKTANYVLVAADAGTTVAMNAAGSTTITVNTGLFAAGDTVFIQNLGAGACTVTAGTATVATAGSLILPQNDAGILYFTATGAAIFYDYIQVGAVSPLTTKGDLYTFSTSDARLGVGANGTTLVADSAEATGLKWATPASGGSGLTLIDEVSYTSSTTINVDNVFSATYNNYKIINRATAGTATTFTMKMRVSGTDTSANYLTQLVYGTGATVAAQANGLGTDEWLFGDTTDTGITSMDIMSPYLSVETQGVALAGYRDSTTGMIRMIFMSQSDNTSFTGFTLLSGSATTGKLSVYGYAKE